jgi:uncharacterized membrane protein
MSEADFSNNIQASLPVSVVVQVGAFAVVGFLAFNAWKQGRHWFWTLVAGALYGLGVEWWNITRSDCSYKYVDPHALSHLGIGVGVPLWVAAGWGAIAYAATWTAQRLAVPRWLHPFAAAFLAVNIDLSLDPLAESVGLWSWKDIPVSFCGVPFDNFLGWIGIVAIYSAAVRTVLHLANKHWGGKRPPWTDCAAPMVSGAIAFAAYALLFNGLLGDLMRATRNPGASSGHLAASVYGLFATLPVLLMVPYAIYARRDRPLNLPTIALPMAMHSLCLGLFILCRDLTQTPALLVAIPANFLVGSIAYAWPFLDTLAHRSIMRFALASPRERVISATVPIGDTGEPSPSSEKKTA